MRLSLVVVGAILAVVVMYFKKLWPFCVDNGRDSGLAKHVRWPVMRLWFKIIVACLPAAVLGLALDDWIDAHFYNSVVVAVMLIVKCNYNKNDFLCKEVLRNV